ncbi:MAG: phosphoribosylanthranilate isomerase [Oscillatoriales cyanobacterium]|nr:MAG: phosphoribosylanthranilate isomerase [Oscillatoriales cyanobacterium]
MLVKICGLKDPDQAVAIAQLGAWAIGFICVPASPRYVNATEIRAVSDRLAAAGCAVERVGVFANTDLDTIAHTVERGALTVVQLHGDESPEFCADLRTRLPGLELWKALRVRSAATLDRAAAYTTTVDRLLLDAYRPEALGGTGHTLDWHGLQTWRSPLPWFLAGGLNPDNVGEAMAALAANLPIGLDLSSGVERAPADKDLDRVDRILRAIRQTIKPPNPPVTTP